MTFDATQVTGSPNAGASARPGDVWAERYELLEPIDVEGPSIGYRALDQETERTVLVHALAGPPLDAATLDEVMGRLRGLIGAGGRFLSPLIDADREGRRPFTVEAWPNGEPLSSALYARRARGEPLSTEEALLIAARLSAAMAALPRGWHHGDLRAERVWLDSDGLRVTGAFLLAALPGRTLGQRMAAIGPAAVAYAPEVTHGRAGAAADRWGAAALVWEALTLRAPDRTSAPRELPAAVLDALQRLLDPDPEVRPADLSSLMEALARAAERPVPRLDPEAQWPAIGPADAGTTAEHAVVHDLDDRRVPAGSIPRRSPRLGGGANPPSPQPLVEEAPGALESAELADEDLVPVEAMDVDLDPRLVRAALGVTDPPPEENARPEAAAPAPRPAGPHPAAAPSGLAPFEPRAERPVAERPVAERPVAERPVAERPVAERPIAERPVAERATAPRAAQGREGGTAILPRPTAPAERHAQRAPAARASGTWIILVAMMLAVLIIGLGFLVRMLLSEERSSAERSRRIQERMEQIRGETSSPP